MQFLLFQVYSPLVSWGEIAVGGERVSASHPSKSSVIGLIAAALGIKRNDEKGQSRLFQSLGVAVKVYSAGSLLSDFHTAQVLGREKGLIHYTRKSELSKKNKLGTILSRREYRCDALYVVGVYCKDGEMTLGEIEKALREPRYHLYFGRKSNPPALPLSPLVVDAENLKEAFSGFTVKFVLPISDNSYIWKKKNFMSYPQETLFSKKVYYFWEEGIESGLDMMYSVERYDVSSSRKRWQFASRKEFISIGQTERGDNVLE